MNTSLTTQFLEDAVFSLWHTTQQLPGHAIPVSEQKRCGGLLFRGAPRFVCLIQRAITSHPDVYPDQHPHADRLRETQTRADLWRDLQTQAQTLADFARQNHLREQAGAVTLARQIFDDVQKSDAAAALLPQLDHAQRRLWLQPAARLLQSFLRSLGARRKSPRKDTGPGDASPVLPNLDQHLRPPVTPDPA